jgi:hypothetical protein
MDNKKLDRMIELLENIDATLLCTHKEQKCPWGHLNTCKEPEINWTIEDTHVEEDE